MEDSSPPDTIEQVDNQTCKARTRVTMQRLLHGLGTQVLGHVQVASPQAPFFPKVPICSPPPPPIWGKGWNFVHTKLSVPWWTGTAVELEAKGQASAQSTTGTVTLGAKREKNKIMIHEWLGILVNLGNLEILEILRHFRHLQGKFGQRE